MAITGHCEDLGLHYKLGNDGSIEELKLLDSVDHVVLVVEPGKTQGSAFDLHVICSLP